ncbi:MAG: GNAT family N-acetyltransferase [Kiritimatiellae bacterium]|nr:GNAT family N-acetyltransferase [Kiritimatiellia bacterium]
MIEFRSPTDFPRGTLYDILVDAYSFDPRNRQLWDADWKQTDDFFYDHPSIADTCALVTCLDGVPIGFVTWDPRNAPASVEIGHNGIRQPFKGRGYGRLQLQEALRRIKSSKSPARILVTTNANLLAPKNYESVGFTILSRTPNPTPSSFTGDFLHYELLP